MPAFSDILNDDKRFSAEDSLLTDRNGAVDLEATKQGSSSLLLSGAVAEHKKASSFLQDDDKSLGTATHLRKAHKRRLEKELKDIDSDIQNPEEHLGDSAREKSMKRRQHASRLGRLGSLAAAPVVGSNGDEDDIGDSFADQASDLTKRVTKDTAFTSRQSGGARVKAGSAKKSIADLKREQALRNAKQVKRKQHAATKANQAKKASLKSAIESQSRARAAADAAHAAKGAKGAISASAGAGLSAVAGIFLVVLLVFILLIGIIVGEQWAEDHRANFEGLTETEQIVAQYLLEHGLDELHTAAIMGNISQECSFDPALIENGSALGIGIFQWPTTADYLAGMSHGNRFKAYAASTGRSWTDIYAQLDYAWYEIAHEEVSGRPSMYADNQWCWNREIGCTAFRQKNNITQSASYENFLAIDDISVATEYFCWGFLRPASTAANVNTRINGDSNGHKGAIYYYAVLTGASGAEGSNAIERAYAQLGKPYVWGACGPNSFDCSGLVGYCITGKYERFCTTETMQSWPRVTDPVPGDFCLNSHHTGIYIGNGMMIHAPRTGDVVKIGPVHSDMFYVRYPAN